LRGKKRSSRRKDDIFLGFVTIREKKKRKRDQKGMARIE